MISNKEYTRGFELCMSNAELWYNEATEIYLDGSYGHSYTLFVNALEAWAQAYACYLNSIGDKVDEKEMELVFTNHVIKIQTVIAIATAHLYANFLRALKINEHSVKEALSKSSELNQQYEEMSYEQTKEILIKKYVGLYVNRDKNSGVFIAPSIISNSEVEELMIFVLWVKAFMRNRSQDLASRKNS
jgi:AbiV family abortive infection protein